MSVDTHQIEAPPGATGDSAAPGRHRVMIWAVDSEVCSPPEP
jgi:hypothetical protein